MSNSQSAIAAVRQASRTASRDRRDIANQLTPPAKISKAEANSLPAKGPATSHAGAMWRSVPWVFLEGFALYGASLHWLATTAVTAIASEVSALQRQKPAARAQHKVIPPVSPSAREVDRFRLVYPGWRTMIGDAIASRRAKWRREREVRKAVDALSQFDDRTLMDMGIPHRSLIEQIVRDGRDC